MKFLVVVCLLIALAWARPNENKSKQNVPQKHTVEVTDKPKVEVQQKQEEQVKPKQVKPEKQDEKYTTKYDNINLDDILKSDRLLLNYVNCLLDKGKCSSDGLELKKSLPDALKTECSKCSEKQKEGSKKIIHFLIDNKRDVWNQLEEKYDDKGEYRKKYEAQIKKEGLKL